MPLVAENVTERNCHSLRNLVLNRDSVAYYIPVLYDMQEFILSLFQYISTVEEVEPLVCKHMVMIILC